MLLVGVHQLPAHETFAVGAVDVVAKHQQERLVADRLARAVDGVTESFLGFLGDESDVPADLQDAPRVLLEVARQLVVVLDRDLRVEEGAEVVEVVFLDDDDDLLDAGLQRLFHDQQDGGLGDAVAVDDREQLLLGRLGGREQARAEARPPG